MVVLDESTYYFDSLIVNRGNSKLYYINNSTSANQIIIGKQWEVHPTSSPGFNLSLSNVHVVLFRKFRNIYHMAESFNSLIRYYIHGKHYPPVIIINPNKT